MAINPQDTKNSLFGGLKKEPKAEAIIIQPESEQIEDTIAIKEESANVTPQEVKENIPEPALPKWASLDKVTVLLTTEQKEGLDRVAKKIMKYRSRDLKGIDAKERITANMLIRALVENFLSKEERFPTEILSSEEDVYEWVKRNSGS